MLALLAIDSWLTGLGMRLVAVLAAAVVLVMLLAVVRFAYEELNGEEERPAEESSGDESESSEVRQGGEDEEWEYY